MSSFRKTTDTRTEYVSTSGEIFGIRDEYDALKQLNETDPENFVEPMYLAYEGMKLQGYVMEGFEGEMLCDYIGEDAPEDVENIDITDVALQLDDAVETIEELNQPHGDLRAWNVLINQDSEIKVIDPAGYPQDHKLSEEMIECDKHNKEQMIQDLKETGSGKTDTEAGDSTSLDFNDLANSI